MNWIAKFTNWMRWLYGDRTLMLVQRMTQEALPVVRIIADLTPTRADDTIVRLCERFMLPALEWYLTIPEESRGIVLADIAVREVNKKFPNAATHQLRLSVEAAVAALRKEQEG